MVSSSQMDGIHGHHEALDAIYCVDGGKLSEWGAGFELSTCGLEYTGPYM